MPSVNFVHTAGDVAVRDIEVVIADGTASITGFVSADTWDHIEMEDVFGARSRSRSGNVVGDGDVRITIEGPETSLGVGPYARDWSIVDAQRRLDGAPVDGEVWTGTTFSDPSPIALAGRALVDTDFSPVTISETRATYQSADGRTVEVYAEPDVRRGHVTVSVDLAPTSATTELELLRAVNLLNWRLPFGTCSLSGSTFAVKGGVPIAEGDDVSQVLEAYAYALPGLVDLLIGPLRDVSSGTRSAADAITEALG